MTQVHEHSAGKWAAVLITAAFLASPCLAQGGRPPKAVTVGPRDVAAAKLRSSWNGFGCGESLWQRFIVRLALHGPVTPRVPASILQLFETEALLSGAVAADCSLRTSERRTPIEFPDT